MAELGSWPSIKKYGLLSTAALLDMYSIQGEQRHKIESCIRPHSVTISNKKYGNAVIRDQKPLSESKLINLLDDNITPSQFYKLLNQRTFFWVREEKLTTLLRARAYRDKSHDVLIVDTEELIKKYENKITLCRINSGATPYNNGRRGPRSFKRIRDYPFNEYKNRGKDAIVELAVDYGIPDIKNYVVRVDVWSKDGQTSNIWKNDTIYPTRI